MSTNIRIIAYLALIGIGGFCASGKAQNIPKMMKPYVQIGSEVVIEIYQNPVIQDRQVVNEGQLVKREMQVWTLGSGTVITPGGLILTNFHVYDFGSVEYDEQNNLLIKILPASKNMLVFELADNDPLKAPVLRYVAEPRGFETSLDVTVLKIIADARTGQPISQGKFDYVPLGNPYAIPLNSQLTIVGYPGKGGSTVTITEGKFLGYAIQAPYALNGSIKTDAAIAGGNSGGAALYDKNLIGIPSRGSLKSEKGSDFGYIHPVTWAIGPLTAAKVKYGERIPEIDKKWVDTDYNTDITRSHLYAAGKVYSVQSWLPLAEALVLVYRADRSYEQIVRLITEIRSIKTILKIQEYHRNGYTVEQLAATYQAPVEEIQKIVNYQFRWENYSQDVQQYLRGEFFYQLAITDAEGFFIMDIPRGQSLNCSVEKDGFRPLRKTLQTGNGVYQDLERIDITQF